MADMLAFQLNLINNMSGPASAAAASLNQLNQIMVQMQQTNITLNSSVQTGSKGFESWATSLSSAMNVATKFKDVIVGVTETVAHLTAGFVEAVLAQAQFHQSAMTTLDALLQDEPGGARREFAGSIRMAQSLPGSAQEVASARVALASMFTDRNERDRMFGLQQDLAALSFDKDASTGPRVTNMIGEINSTGFLQSKALRELVYLKTGIGKGDVFKQIAQARGIHGTPQEIFEQVRGLVENNQVTSAEGLAAIQNAVVAKTHMDLGGMAHRQGAGLIGQISNLRELGNNTLLTLFSRQENTTSSPGMNAFLEFLTKTNKFFEQGTATGERFLAVVDSLINTVFGQLFSNDPTPILTTLLGVFEQLVPVVGTTLAVLRALWGGFADTLLPALGPLLEMFSGLGDLELMNGLREYGQILGVIAAAVVYLLGGLTLLSMVMTSIFSDAIVSVVSGVTELAKWLYEAGGNLIKGLADGFMAKATWLWDAVKHMAHGTIELFKEIWDLHSPSVVMFKMGGFLSEGLALGVESGQDRVSEALSSSFRVNADLTGVRASGARGGGPAAPISMHVTFNVPNSATSAQDIADATKPMFESALAELVERMAISAGVG